MQTTLLVHPAYHSFFGDFCHCLAPGSRLAFLTRLPPGWIEATGYNEAGPGTEDIFVACISAPVSGLFREWVVFPAAIVVLVLICVLQVGKVQALWKRYTESAWHKKQQHDPGYLVIDGNRAHERAQTDPLWRAPPPDPPCTRPPCFPRRCVSPLHASEMSVLCCNTAPMIVQTHMPCPARRRCAACRSEVTLVCTDVEGSTSMWEWNSAVMQEAIFAHDSVLRKLIPEHSGIEVMTEGDAFIMAFHDEHDAVAYCLHAQARPAPRRSYPALC